MERGGPRDVRALSRHAVLPAGKAADREPLRVSIREQRRGPGVRLRRERNRGTRRGASSRQVSGAPSSSGTPFQARRAATSRWRVASWTPDPLLCRNRDVRPRSLLLCAGALHRDAATRRLRSPFTPTPRSPAAPRRRRGPPLPERPAAPHPAAPRPRPRPAALFCRGPRTPRPLHPRGGGATVRRFAGDSRRIPAGDPRPCGPGDKLVRPRACSSGG